MSKVSGLVVVNPSVKGITPSRTAHVCRTYPSSNLMMLTGSDVFLVITLVLVFLVDGSSEYVDYSITCRPVFEFRGEWIRC